ncbi:MAG: S41 family peptidase [Actinomycetota bacterium]|nr:S41 family peptidase [Actinomycetota bacterium]
MDRWQKIALAALCAVIVALGSFSFGFSLGRPGGKVPLFGSDSGDGDEVVAHALERIRSSAVDPPSEKELTQAAVRGMVTELKKSQDPYASFYSPLGYRAFQEYTSGRFSGIGVWLKERAGKLEIVSVLPRTPAVKAGLRRGDVIRRVDGESVGEMSSDEAVGRIKGPSGSEVELAVIRGSRLIELSLTRRSIDLPNVVARLQESGLGYIRLYGFARGAGSQLRDRVHRLRSTGAEGVILDLRDNGGGLFSEAIDVASVFIEDGDIVTYKEGSDIETVYEAEGQAYEELPLVVLVNEGTASASEIVAGALQDRQRAILVGSTTYGKGSVQNVFPLPDASALKITTGAYLTPAGRDINGEGIEPDVEIAGGAALQKRRAAEILEGIVLSTTGAQG